MPKAMMLLDVEDLKSFAEVLACPVLHLYLTLHARGEMNWEQSMQAAACELSRVFYLQRRVIAQITAPPGHFEDGMRGDVLDVIRGFDLLADGLRDVTGLQCASTSGGAAGEPP